MLGTRTLYERGVMISWLGHWDAMWVLVHRAILGVVWFGRIWGANQ